eukprot:3380095-Prymnesium_polylepis.1
MRQSAAVRVAAEGMEGAGAPKRRGPSRRGGYGGCRRAKAPLRFECHRSLSCGYRAIWSARGAVAVRSAGSAGSLAGC